MFITTERYKIQQTNRCREWGQSPFPLTFIIIFYSGENLKLFTPFPLFVAYDHSNHFEIFFLLVVKKLLVPHV